MTHCLLPKKRHKYGAKAQICNLGHHHPSKAEALHCWALQAQIKANLIKDLEYERPFEIKVAGSLICVHKPDFFYKRKVGNISGTAFWYDSCVDEVKGCKTADWIIKSKLFQALYPGIQYRVVT